MSPNLYTLFYKPQLFYLRSNTSTCSSILEATLLS